MRQFASANEMRGFLTDKPRELNAAPGLGKIVLAIPMDASMQNWFNE